VSALPEVVDDGENGFLVARDDVAGYAEKVRILGEDAGLRRRFGEHGRAKVVTHFGYGPLGEGFRRLYEQLCGK
jgi:glycosyltransferase involved in cell wall biosynthesis